MRPTIFLFTYLYFLFFLCNSAQALDAKKLFKETKDSVVLVMSFDKNNQPLAIGSGFFVGNGKNEKILEGKKETENDIDIYKEPDKIPSKNVETLPSEEQEVNEKSIFDLLDELVAIPIQTHNQAIIVTNYHVIAGATSVVIKLSNGTVSKINTILGIDTKHDLVLLESLTHGKILSLSKRPPDIGEDIIAIGNPKGLEGTLSTGIVSGHSNAGIKPSPPEDWTIS